MIAAVGQMITAAQRMYAAAQPSIAAKGAQKAER
jgi:hypothetical protein